MESSDSATNNPETETTNDSWGGVTNPEAHNPYKFRYLVHSFNPGASTTMNLLESEYALRGVFNDSSSGDQSIDLLTYPEKLAERVSLSMSLIDQDHLGTWGKAGIIVQAPPRNVVITSTSDAGAPSFNAELLIKQGKTGNLLSPDTLLASTSPRRYNEVVAIANLEGSTISLVGLFYKTKQDGRALDDYLAEAMRNHGRRLGLPVIAISEPNLYQEERIDTRDNTLAVHLDGKRYLINGYERDRNFNVIDQTGFSSFAPPIEMQSVYRFLSKNGYSEQELEEIEEKYLEADKRRQMPVVEYGDDGSVSSVRMRRKYGNNEEDVFISKNGYARKTNRLELAREFTKMSINRNMPRHNSEYDASIMSPQEVQMVIDELLKTLTVEESIKINNWYQSILKVVETNYTRYHPPSVMTYKLT